MYPFAPRLITLAMAVAAAAPFALTRPIVARNQSAPVDTSRALTIAYADGRTLTRPLRARGGMWTPTFPRVGGADTSRNTLPLSALDVSHVIDGPDVIVTVSLAYGGPTKNLVKVATVRVRPEAPVHVNELRAHGVEPIVLSLAVIPATIAYVPEGISASGQVDIRVEPVGPNVSAYRLVLTNRSSVPLMWVRFTAYRGDRQVMSGQRSGKRNVSLVLPNSEHAFDVTSGVSRSPTDGSETWQALDRFEIVSLLWQDGLIEGDPGAARGRRTMDARRGTQISELLTVLRGARERPIASLQSRIARTMSLDSETRQARDAVLADLEAFSRTQRSREGHDFGTWLTRTIAEYEEWLGRIEPPKL